MVSVLMSKVGSSIVAPVAIEVHCYAAGRYLCTKSMSFLPNCKFSLSCTVYCGSVLQDICHCDGNYSSKKIIFLSFTAGQQGPVCIVSSNVVPSTCSLCVPVPYRLNQYISAMLQQSYLKLTWNFSQINHSASTILSGVMLQCA